MTHISKPIRFVISVEPHQQPDVQSKLVVALFIVPCRYHRCRLQTCQAGASKSTCQQPLFAMLLQHRALSMDLLQPCPGSETLSFITLHISTSNQQHCDRNSTPASFRNVPLFLASKSRLQRFQISYGSYRYHSRVVDPQSPKSSRLRLQESRLQKSSNLYHQVPSHDVYGFITQHATSNTFIYADSKSKRSYSALCTSYV